MGALFAFVIVGTSVIVLRYLKPDIPRPFRVPLSPFIPALSVLLCGYLILVLSLSTQIRFLVWLAIGIVIYFSYGYRKSSLSVEEKPDCR